MGWGMPKHRLSRKNRYIALAATGAVVVAGAGVAAQTSMAAPAWPAQKTYTGRAFDACTAPSLTAMKAWKSDAYYGGVAVYVGGKNRGCAQPNLTKSWVKSLDTLGWRVIPLIGRPVERLYSVAEPAQRHALRVSAISYAGTVGVGVCSDPEALPGVAGLADAISGSIAELRRAAIG